MCGRFAFFSPREAVQEYFGIDVPFALEPRYNVAPSQEIAVIRQPADTEPEAAMLKWGLVPFWAKDAAIGARMINARAETVAQKPAFRQAFKRRRMNGAPPIYLARDDLAETWFPRNSESRVHLGLSHVTSNE